MRWKGSYTVEAAFVIPIVLGVVFVLLYALFWAHDQCVLQANIQNGLIQYSDIGEELPTNEEWKRTLQQNLWMGSVTETAISHKRTLYGRMILQQSFLLIVKIPCIVWNGMNSSHRT